MVTMPPLISLGEMGELVAIYIPSLIRSAHALRFRPLGR
jgi:hypothetical protein